MKKIDDMTIAEARALLPQSRQLLQMFGEEAPSSASGSSSTLPFPEGTAVYCRTVTYHCVGRVKGRRGQWLDLEDASYIGTDGRFSQATEKGVQNVEGSEIERVGNGGLLVVNLEAVVDVTKHIDQLPQNTK